jgi:hypothetical protein
VKIQIFIVSITNCNKERKCEKTMRRRTLRLVTLTFLLVITLSYATVLLAKSPAPDTSLIIQKLQQLQEDVNDLPADAFKNPALAENKQNTLENKLGAVIHQIQAGAFNGSINKLENDLKNSITNWVTPEYAKDLIRKIDEIIDLITGKKPAPDFALKATPNSLTIVQNSSAQSTITVQSLNSFNQTVSLNVTSAPITHVTTTLSQLQVTPPANGTANGTLTVKVAVNAQSGNYTITVSGTNGTLERAVNITLTITQVVTVPDFTITAYPDSLIVQQGSSNTSVLTVTSLVGFSQPVNLTVTSLSITGVNATVQPSPIKPQPNQSALSILTVKAANNTAVGNYTVTVTGSNGTLQHNVDIKLTVKEKTPEPQDTTAPTISSVQRTPETPAYNESVTVTALVYDVESGVKQVVLNYSRGSTITIVNMSLAEGVYKAVIPAFAYNITVEYRVLAFDNADNMAASSLCSYRVADPYPPMLRIDMPVQGNYVSGTFPIVAVIRDQNGGGESGFASAELSINSVIVEMIRLYEGEDKFVYAWNTATFGPDGVCTIKLSVRDIAGNVVEKTLWVVVDNTLPSAVIEAPADGGFLRLSTVVKVNGSDLNFDKMELRIDDKLVETYLSSGSQVFEWNTRSYSDSVHSVTLKVFDKARNVKEALVNVVVDNSAPIIGVPFWLPEEPEANVDVQVNVTVFEPAYGSGVANVTLQFKNGTMDEWLSVPMTFDAGNWTATLSNQSDTLVEFFIVAFDRAGNRNQTDSFEFTVAAPGFPLLWLLIIIIILLAILIGAAAYLYVRRRRKKREGEGAAVPPTMPPSSPGVEVLKPVGVAAVLAAASVAALTPAPSRGFGMVSFLVAAHNEEGTIASRIGKAFERAAAHKGSSEVIVVDDGSLDGTYELAWEAVKANRAKYPNIPAKVMKLSTYMGKEEAIRFGSRKATGEIIETVNGENTPNLPALMGHLLLTL